MYLVIYPPRIPAPTAGAPESIFAIHSFLEGRTRFSSFDSNLVVSDQRQLGTYPLLSALACSTVEMLPSQPYPQMSLPLAHPRAPSYAILARHGSSGTFGETPGRAIPISRRERYLKSKHFLGIFASNGTEGLSESQAEVGHGHEILFHSDTRSEADLRRAYWAVLD